MALEDKVRDEFGAGKAIGGLATAALLKGVGAFDNFVAYSLYNTINNFIGVTVPYLLFDPIVQVGAVAAGLTTAGAVPGKQRTAGTVLLGATTAYALYSYVRNIGVAGSYLMTGAFAFSALQSAVLPILALYAIGYVGRNLYRTCSHFFKKIRRNQSYYDEKKRLGYKRAGT